MVCKDNWEHKLQVASVEMFEGIALETFFFFFFFFLQWFYM